MRLRIDWWRGLPGIAVLLLMVAFSTTARSQQGPAATSDSIPTIGLAVGQKAPAFSLRDQFGRTHTLESLRGPRGTVLLFFRSADW